MKSIGFGGTAFLAIALVVVLGACAAVPSLSAPHAEGSEACCGLADCSALTIGLLGFLVLAFAAFPRQGRASRGRSPALQPISPPPEPLLLGAA